MEPTERTAADLAVRHPKTLPADASVGDVRAQLADDHVHLALLLDGRRLAGTLLRDDLVGAPDTDPALRHAVLAGRVVAPDLRADLLHDDLVRRQVRRAAVVAADGTLVGLVCLNGRWSGWCTDEGVAARAAERRAPA